MLALFVICSGLLFFTGETDPSAALPIAQARTSFAAQVDAIMSGVYKPNQPGAAILVRKGGTVLVRKAYGMADLELGVALEPGMVFQIASMTKQFTAVAILMLIEQGRLRLSDPITRFLSDYPTPTPTSRPTSRFAPTVMASTISCSLMIPPQASR